MKKIRNNIIFLTLFLLSLYAEASDFICPVEAVFNNLGYSVNLIDTSHEIFTNFDDFKSSTYVFMSPDEIDKFHFAVIYESVSSCVKQSKEEDFCVHLKEGMNNNPFLKTCNWYFDNDGVSRYN